MEFTNGAYERHRYGRTSFQGFGISVKAWYRCESQHYRLLPTGDASFEISSSLPSFLHRWVSVGRLFAQPKSFYARVFTLSLSLSLSFSLTLKLHAIASYYCFYQYPLSWFLSSLGKCIVCTRMKQFGERLDEHARVDARVNAHCMLLDFEHHRNVDESVRTSEPRVQEG